jgi:hypothetical protein
MGKINEGDVIEGLFSIGLALYLADGKIDKTKLNRLRAKIEPSMFATGRVKVTVADAVVRRSGTHPPDKFTVNIEMRLKPASVTGAFGKDFNKIYYSKSKDIGKIDQKIDQLVKSVSSSAFSSKVRTLVHKFLDNNKSEKVVFVVIADGIAGESSGGEIKGDVTLNVYADVRGRRTLVKGGSIPFSLKSGSVTVANLSPYKGMVDIAKALKIDWNGEEKYERLTKPFSGQTEMAAKFKLIKKMYDELKVEVVKESKKTGVANKKFTEHCLNFLGKSIFGEDRASVVDIQESKVKEITPEYFDYLKKTVELVIEAKGNNLVFVDKNSKMPIFQIRTKLRPPPANEAKFYLEVGKGIYSPEIHKS